MYVALAGVVVVVLLQSLRLIRDIRVGHSVAARVNDDASWSMQRIADRMHASAVTAPAPGQSSATLVFDDGWSVVQEDGVLMEQTATQSVRLTGDDILVSDLTFQNHGSTGADIITVSFSASFRRGSGSAEPLEYERSYETSISSHR